MKRFLNRIRHQYHLSLLARCIAWPMACLCRTVADQLRMKVWVNGGTVEYDGISLAFPRNVGVGYASNIYWNGVNGFEPDTWRVIRHFLLRSTLFVDVGSNIGFYSVLARKLKNDLQIISCEPVPSIFDKNVTFHKANGCAIGSVLNIAIGDREGFAEIFLPVSPDGVEEETTATLRKDSWQCTKACETFKVKVVTLDNLLEQTTKEERVLVKVDVEDFEANVFKGASRLMRDVKPIFVCEILPRKHGNQETFDVLEANGYVAFGITSAGLIRFDREDFFGERSFTDFLVIPESIAPNLNYLHHSLLHRIQ